MKVLLLAGGTSFEHDVSMRSGDTIETAIKELGYEYTRADPRDKNFNIANITTGCDVVFIALHGKNGEDGKIQKALEDLRLPFTGSNSKSSILCADKWKFKHFLDEHNIRTPNGGLVSIHRKNDKIFDNPYVIKPYDEGSSFDTLIVRKPDSTSKELTNELLENHVEMLAEELIDGPEITVGIFNDRALPVIEIVPPEGEEFDYENKYNGKTKELIPPVNVSDDLQKEAQDIALKIHNLAGCRDMSRTDFMINESGELFVLETNTIPGLTSQSLLPKMIQSVGNTIPEFVDTLLKNALNRQS